ncbi:MAG: choice-of-anchor P family protein [Marmoricola sp.]
MHRITRLVVAAAMTSAAALAAGALPASAAASDWTYAGASGGTQVNALGTTISSGLTASSNLAGNTYPASHGTAALATSVPNLVKVGVVTSGQTAQEIPGGVQIDSTAETAGVNLLNGAIKADALKTTATASVVDGVPNGSASTQLVHLTLGGTTIPIDVAPNTKIVIPGIASVVINESKVEYYASDAAVRARGAALHVTLLKPQGGAPAGAEIYVDPVMALLVPSLPSDAEQVGGTAYGLFAGVGVSPNVKVVIQPTGQLNVPSYGTNNTTVTNNVAGVNAQNVAKVGAVTTSMRAVTVPGFAEVTTGTELAKLNLLNGLITADALQVTSHTLHAGPIQESDAKLNFVRLTIAGKPIAINLAKNSTINILGIAKIYLNQQVLTSHSSYIAGLRVVLSTAKYGLPIGAVVEVGVAYSFIGTP